jgi:hypothetical protein
MVLLTFNHLNVTHAFIAAKYLRTDFYAAITFDTFTQVNLRNLRHNSSAFLCGYPFITAFSIEGPELRLLAPRKRL